MVVDKAQRNPDAHGNDDRDRALGQVDAWSRAKPGTTTVAVLTIGLGLALWSIPHQIQAGDAGEFATVMLRGGVPHPSGYPWMRILGLVAQLLWALGVPPTVAAALPPALCGVAALVVVQRSCVALDQAWLGAVLLVLVAASPLVVIHVNDSEVWGPHLLFSALFMHTVVLTASNAGVAGAGLTPGKRVVLLGLLLGLAVSHHLTAIWLVPLAIAAASPAWAPERGIGAWLRTLLRNGGLGLLGSALGLLSYASLALGRDGGWVWGDLGSVDGVLAHITRRDYGTFNLSLHHDEVAIADTVARALRSVGEVFTAGLVSSPLVGALILVGACAGTCALAPRLGRACALAWTLTLLATGLGFPAMQNIDPTAPFGAWILERFDLLTVLLMIVPLAAGLAWVHEKLLISARARTTLRYGAGAIAAALLAAQLGAAVERGRPRTEAAIELAAIDLLETPDPRGFAIPSAQGPPIRAIVFGTDDHRSFPALYAQAVLGAGQHTLYIDAQLLAHPWYRARLRTRVPTLPDIDKPLALIGAIWSDPELAGVSIYLANVFSAPAARLTKLPEGMLWRIPPPADHPVFVAADWTAEAIAARHLAAYARYRVEASDFAGLTHPRGHPWSADLWFAYVDKARALADSLAHAGLGDQAEAVLAALDRRTGAEGR